MKNSFTITRAQVVASDPATLMASILAGTGNERAAASVMRSLERMGTSPFIEYFEMTEVSGGRRNGGAPTTAWRVRADRGAAEADDAS